MGVYRDIRDDMVDIYVAAFLNYPKAREAFESKSLSEIQKLAGQKAVSAQTYDPFGTVSGIGSILGGVTKLIEVVLVGIIVLGAIGIGGVWTASARGQLSTLNEFSGLLISIIVGGGSSLLVIVAGGLLLYIRLISFSSTAIGIIYRDLTLGMDQILTRDSEQIIGVYFWNSSLNSPTAIRLITIFSALWLLNAAIPGWNPYKYAKVTVMEHIDVFHGSDGFWDATGRVVRRMGEDAEVDDQAEDGTLAESMK